MTRHLATMLVLGCLFTTALPGEASALVAADDSCQAGAATLAAPGDDGSPVAQTPCPGVRPGALVLSDTTSGGLSSCTLNFLFTHTDEGGTTTRYMGTAGHCVLHNYTARTWPSGEGNAAYITTASGAREQIGHYVYAVQSLDLDRDFALIELLDDVVADPQLCHWGGPTGISTEQSRGLLTQRHELRHFGHGTVVSAVATARTAYATDLDNPERVWMAGAATWGDSGSAVIHADGRALGVLVAIGGMRNDQMLRGDDAGYLKVQRLPYELAEANAVLNTDLQLATAELL
jgi:hypothetical protein